MMLNTVDLPQPDGPMIDNTRAGVDAERKVIDATTTSFGRGKRLTRLRRRAASPAWRRGAGPRWR